MVVIVHSFDRDFRAHVVESWLDYYLPFAELKGLLVPAHHHGHHQNQRWALLRRLLPRAAAQRVLAVLPQLGGGSGRPHRQSQSQSQSPSSLGSRRAFTPSSASFFGPVPGPPKKKAGGGACAGAGSGPSTETAPAAAPPGLTLVTGAGESTSSPTGMATARWPITKDSTLRFAAAAKSALALATPGPASTSTAHTAAATTPGTRLSPSPSISSVASAAGGDVITMADLGRSDSLERFNSLGGGAASFDLGDLGAFLQENSPEAREVLAQQAFLEALKQAADKCNTFFVQESDRLVREYAESLAQLKAAERALATMAKHRTNLANFKASEVWSSIKAVYKNLHREVKELRSFSRCNFDLAIRLVKAYRKAVGRSSNVAGAMWRYVRLASAQGVGCGPIHIPI